jgi:hypothetical protein
MKKAIIFSIILLATYTTFAQTDTSKIEQYCQVIATPRLLSNKVTISIDFGEEKSIWSDNRIKNIDGKIKKFNTVIDALNFMGREGWSFINAFPVTTGTTTIYHFAFKKLFSKKDLQEKEVARY